MRKLREYNEIVDNMDDAIYNASNIIDEINQHGDCDKDIMNKKMLQFFIAFMNKARNQFKKDFKEEVNYENN